MLPSMRHLNPVRGPTGKSNRGFLARAGLGRTPGPLAGVHVVRVRAAAPGDGHGGVGQGDARGVLDGAVRRGARFVADRGDGELVLPDLLAVVEVEEGDVVAEGRLVLAVPEDDGGTEWTPRYGVR